MSEFILNNQHISLDLIKTLLTSNDRVVLGDTAIQKIQGCRDYLDQRVSQGEELIYGVNTGFGSLCNTAISKDDLARLQLNLVRSHACGTGKLVPKELVKTMLLLKAIGLSLGHSGAQVETVNRLLYFYNNNIIPVVYQQGSLGASGDLAPLAHIALALFGEGEVYVKGAKTKTSEVFSRLKLDPISLKSKEGLALLNGTQFMSTYLLKAVLDGKELLQKLNLIGALSLEAYDGRFEPFNELVHHVRNQVGQINVAKEIRGFLKGSKLIKQPKKHVQDPYSFRCMPQVHGASFDAIEYAAAVVTREINAVTDNPTIFVKENEVISAGNFHGQPLAITMDFLSIAIAELGSISERRIYKLLGGERELPPFLVANPGLNSGFMIAQYTAASIVSQNKQFCTPASIDTIDSSNGQEDHVSMGANSGTKLYEVMENVWQIAGIELMTASQGLNFRAYKNSSNTIMNLFENFRKSIPFIEEDKYMSEYLRGAKDFIYNFNINT